MREAAEWRRLRGEGEKEKVMPTGHPLHAHGPPPSCPWTPPSCPWTPPLHAHGTPPFMPVDPPSCPWTLPLHARGPPTSCPWTPLHARGPPFMPMDPPPSCPWTPPFMPMDPPPSCPWTPELAYPRRALLLRRALLRGALQRRRRALLLLLMRNSWVPAELTESADQSYHAWCLLDFFFLLWCTAGVPEEGDEELLKPSGGPGGPGLSRDEWMTELPPERQVWAREMYSMYVPSVWMVRATLVDATSQWRRVDDRAAS